jgi:hypothetical protein
LDDSVVANTVPVATVQGKHDKVQNEELPHGFPQSVLPPWQQNCLLHVTAVTASQL